MTCAYHQDAENENRKALMNHRFSVSEHDAELRTIQREQKTCCSGTG